MNHQIGDLLHYVRRGVILQQVNAQNRMGSGFAKAVYERWPQVKPKFHAWSETFTDPKERMGKIGSIEVEPGLWVVNIVGQFETGNDGKRYTSYDALDDGLQMVHHWLKWKGFYHYDVNFPLLGSDLGGGHWPVVKALIEHHIGPDTTLWTLK